MVQTQDAQTQLCPLLIGTAGQPLACKGTECAWFLAAGGSGRCSIPVLANSLIAGVNLFGLRFPAAPVPEDKKVKV